MNERDQQLLRQVLGADQQDRFAPGFAERTVTRWQNRRKGEPTLEVFVIKQFRWLVPVAIAATLLLAVQNVRHREATRGQTVMESLIGLQPVTLDAMYGFGAQAPAVQE